MSRVKHNIADASAHKLFDEAGQHCLLTGATGSGKTTLLYWLTREFLKKETNETVIFRDTGKGNESVFLRKFRELRYFVPKGCNIICPDNSVDFEVCEFLSYDDIFNHITKDKINIVSVWRFLIDDHQLTDFWAYFFKELVERSLDYQLPTPLTVVVDELSQIAPSYIMTNTQHKLCGTIKAMVETLRSLEIRLLGTSQGWTKLYKGVRISFPYYIFKRVAERVDIDIPILRKTMNKIQSLRPDQFIIVVPEKYYTNPYSGIPDLKIKEFCKQHRLKYEGRLGSDWKCESKFRLEDTNKYKEKYEELLQGVKIIINHFCNLKVTTQKDFANMLGVSQSTISNWVNEIKNLNAKISEKEHNTSGYGS